VLQPSRAGGQRSSKRKKVPKILAFWKLVNRLRIVLGYWCEHYNEQCMRNGRSMPIEGKTTTL
jgi:hypothetical protein